MKRVVCIFCVFVLFLVGCNSKQTVENEVIAEMPTIPTKTIAPTPTTRVEFGKVGTEEYGEPKDGNIKAGSLDDLIDGINGVKKGEFKNEKAEETLQKVKNDGFVLFPFFDGKPVEIETLTFYAQRSKNPALILMNAYSGDYCFRIYIYYLNSEEVEATKEFGANGYFGIASGKTFEQLQKEKKIVDSANMIAIKDRNVSVEKYVFDNRTYTKIPVTAIYSKNTNKMSDILIKESENRQMAEYVIYDEFMIRVYGGLKTEAWTNIIDMSIFDHLTIEKVPLQK